MEQTKESKRIIGGKMYVINIKSRYEQTPQKYVKLFEQLYAKDPLILLHSNRYISIKQLLKSEYLEDDGTPRMLLIKLISYDILNPDVNPEKPDVPLNKNDAFQKVQKRHVQEKR